MKRILLFCFGLMLLVTGEAGNGDLLTARKQVGVTVQRAPACQRVTSPNGDLMAARKQVGVTAQRAPACQRVTSPNGDLVVAARKQIGVTTQYVPAYQRIAYPNGDVPREQGVCVDVVIRALRDARKVDLQKLVHEDMKANFARYPKDWGLTKTDTNIDHRRVPNLQCYFKRKGYAMPSTRNAADYHPGDFVTCLVTCPRANGVRPRELPHIMLVSDKKSKCGTPLVIHNIGQGTQEEDALFTWRLTGHYRMK